MPGFSLEPHHPAQEGREKQAHGPIEHGYISRHWLILPHPDFDRGVRVVGRKYGAVMEVEVIRSARRHKTVQAKLVDGVLRVSIPAAMTAGEEAHWVAEMQRRISKKTLAGQVDLVDRAAKLADKHGLPRPESIVWSSRQNSLWGSASIATGRVRISDRLAGYPRWVTDYVIVHELAHLLESHHTDAFWQLAERYPLTERARGYLIARGEVGD